MEVIQQWAEKSFQRLEHLLKFMSTLRINQFHSAMPDIKFLHWTNTQFISVQN